MDRGRRPAYGSVLGLQSFSGSDLLREATESMKNGSWDTSTSFVLVFNNKILVRKGIDGDYALAFKPINVLVDAGYRLDAVNQACLYFRHELDPSTEYDLPVYYLGNQGTWSTPCSFYACDMSAISAFGRGEAAWDDELFMDIRTFLANCVHWEHVAYAGRALALIQWHKDHQFCSKCGSATTSILAGSKRQCVQNPLHKHYPRTDPVVITLVVLESPGENPSKEKILLGRSKNLPPGTLTCLSGFVDQCESIEEAVAREVKEESGLVVDTVEILGSQPWPIGRGGSCELMIGCLATTTSEQLNINDDEMAECRWVDREEVLAALKNSINPDSPFIKRRDIAATTTTSGGEQSGGGQNQGSSAFFVPPPYAIAHHLLKYWAENTIERRVFQINKL
jgi:NAD+ diphosphatase